MVDRDTIIEIFKKSPTPTLILEADPPHFTILQANDAYMEVVGRNVKDLIGKDLFEAFPPNSDDLDGDGTSQVEKSFNKVINSKEPHRIPGIRHDVMSTQDHVYRERYWEVENTPVLNDNNEVEFIINSIHDITNEKKLEDKLEQAYKLAKIGIWELDVENNDLYWSKYVKEIHGVDEHYEPDLQTDKKFYKKGWSRDKINAAVEQAINEGTSFDLELIIVTAKGEEKWVRAVGKAEMQDGVCKRLYGSTQDITNRKTAELNLIESNKALHERVKEQQCLYEISNLNEQELSIPQLLNKAIIIIPKGFQWEGITEVRISWNDEFFKTEHFSPTPFKLVEQNRNFDNTSFSLEVCYNETKGSFSEDPFLKEERQLFKAIANQLSQKIDQIQKRNQLKRTEEKYRNVVEHSTNMFYQHNTDGVLTYVSPQCEEFLGYSPIEAKQKWTEFSTNHPLNEKGINLTRKAIETGEPQPPYELQLKKGDGQLIWVEVNEAPLKKNGEVIGIVGSLTNITDRINYEEQLKESLERYNYVTKATRDAIYDWDIREDHLHWGEGFNTLFGHPSFEDKFPLEKWAALVHPDDKKEIQGDLSAALSNSDINHWGVEYRFQKANGTYAYVLENGYIVRDENGKATRMIGALRDITESKQAEIQKQLQHRISQYFTSEKSINSILAGVLKHLAESGDFNTAEIWLKSQLHTHLNLIETYAKNKKGKAFYKKSKHIECFKKGEGIPGKVWEKQEIEIWDQIDSDPNFLRHHAAKKAGLKSAMAFPLFHNEELIGVLMFACEKNTGSFHHEKYLFEGLQHFLGAEIKRKQQEEQMQLLFDSAPDILAITSADNHFIKVNPAFSKLLGYSEEEIISQPFQNFIHPYDLAETEKEYKETVTGERQASNYINRWRTKSGEYRWISWNSSDVFGEDGFVFAFGRDITNVKKSNEKLKTAQEIAKLGYWELNLETSEIYWSDEAYNIWELEDYKGNVDLDLILDNIHPDDREKFFELHKKVIANENSFDFQHRILLADGSVKWLHAVANVRKLPEGSANILEGTVQDITEKKALELLLNQTNRLAKVGSWELDLSKKDNVSLYWSDMTREILEVPGDYNPNQTKGIEFFEPKSREIAKQAGKKAIENGTPFDEELMLTTAKGNIKWVRCIGDTDFVGDQCVRMYGSFQDITHRKQAEIELEESYEEKETILESIGDGFFTLDESWKVNYWNREAERLMQTPRKDVINQNLWDVFPDAVEMLTYTNFHRAMHEQKDINFEEYYPNLDKWFDLSVYPSSKGISVFFKDISERKKARQQLEKLNKKLEERADELAASNAELEQFAYVASHDLQEPLRMVTSFLTQLEKKYSPQLDDKANQYIHFAVDGAQRMRQIILDLLNYSRLNKDKHNREEVDLNLILDEVQSLSRTQIEKSGAEISIKKLPTMKVNPGAIKQAFQNLIGNAIKYQKPGDTPKIEINAQELDTHWKLSISDNGIGINPEFEDTIFQIFQRLHTQDQYSGTGIGLAITKKIIERHGGKIWVDSEEGKGSIFYFTIQK